MTTTEEFFRSMLESLDEFAAGLRAVSEAAGWANRATRWDLRIAFADTEKQRRRLRRDRAREYRRPALIHKGGKP
jgi:hypothetical protein